MAHEKIYAAEDYQGARIYKQWSRTLLALANEIEELEVEKLRAVNVEDFDEAERLKVNGDAHNVHQVRSCQLSSDP
jgi:hypothetical protein